MTARKVALTPRKDGEYTCAYSKIGNALDF